MSDLVLVAWRVIAAWLECFPEKPSWCRNVGLSARAKSVKRFELDTALYKNYLSYFFFT